MRRARSTAEACMARRRVGQDRLVFSSASGRSSAPGSAATGSAACDGEAWPRLTLQVRLTVIADNLQRSLTRLTDPAA